MATRFQRVYITCL